MTVVQGPWSGRRVRQPNDEQPAEWWYRSSRGRLWVRINRQWVRTPVLEAEGRVPLGEDPNRQRITVALDALGMWGPEVDEALGFDDDTVVDQWESGYSIPMEPEIRRLAYLTGKTPDWFYGPDWPPAMAGIKLWETRPWPPNGDMRPDGVRGLPGKQGVW